METNFPLLPILDIFIGSGGQKFPLKNTRFTLIKHTAVPEYE